VKKVTISLEKSIYDNIEKVSRIEKRSIREVIADILQYQFAVMYEEPVLESSSFKFIDLFAGIGGFRIAFEAANGQCVFTSEWDKFAQKTYFANFGVIPHGDITKIDENSIPDHDILVAGFPCQPFSIAGVSKKNSLGESHGFMDKTQGTLFFDIVRIINAKRPKGFLLENVKNLTSHDKGRTWQIIQESLDELGYDIFSKVVDGQGYVPQHRERILIIGFDRKFYDGNLVFDFSKLEDKKTDVRLGDILESEVDSKYTLTDHLWNYLQDYAARHKAKGNGFGYGLVGPESTTRTLSARYHKDGSEILLTQKDNNPRRLTPRECARLQGFPDTFEIPVSDTQAYRQFGNSVVVPLMTQVAKQMANLMGFAEKE